MQSSTAEQMALLGSRAACVCRSQARFGGLLACLQTPGAQRQQSLNLDSMPGAVLKCLCAGR